MRQGILIFQTPAVPKYFDESTVKKKNRKNLIKGLVKVQELCKFVFSYLAKNILDSSFIIKVRFTSNDVRL